MGFFDNASAVFGAAAMMTQEGTRRALTTASNGLSKSVKIMNERENSIAAGVAGAVNASGELFSKAGVGLAVKADAISKNLHPIDVATNGKALRAAAYIVGGYMADGVSGLGNFTGKFGLFTQRVSPAIGGAVGSAGSGIVETFSGVVDSVAITEGDFDALRTRLDIASRTARADADRTNAAIARARVDHNKKRLLDLLVVGGITLADIQNGLARTPADVEQAFRFAYPGLAANGEMFSDVARRLSADDIIGLVSGVKGKLFEIELVDQLNAGGLAAGLHAELAGSATQSGYDIKIIDDDGNLVDVLQAKATESVAYVKEALERYPNIDVTTTSEVHAQLTALAVTDSITDSGISEYAVRERVEEAIASGHLDAGDLMPSFLGLALLALSSLMEKGLTLEEQGVRFGGRAARAGVTAVAANTALLATNMWWLALVVGVGSRWLTSHGGSKRQRYETLESIVVLLEKRTLQKRQSDFKV